jgi:SARP family transcriptional regulator, regulator of embCAB operon
MSTGCQARLPKKRSDLAHGFDAGVASPEAVVMTGEQSPKAGVARQGRLRLWLIGSFRLATARGEVAIGDCGARLLALLALRERRITRCGVAGTLWPETSDDHAHGSLRSALRRLPKPARRAVDVRAHDLALAPGVEVDLSEGRALAFRLLDPAVTPRAGDLTSDAMRALSADLLPDWYEDWIRPEADAWRQLRVHALEALASRLVAARRYGEAATAATVAVRADPMRESASAALIRVHLAEGNQSDALEAFRRYRTLIRAELDLEPTSLVHDLVRGLEPDPSR